MCNTKVHVGQQLEAPYRQDNSPTELVQRFYRPIQNTGRNITCDNYFIGYELSNTPLTQKTTIIGTPRKRQVPKEFTNANKHQEKTAMFGFQENWRLSPLCAEKK